MATILEQLAAELQDRNVRFKAGLPTGTPSQPNYTGPLSLFGVPGLERDVISTRVQPRGIAGMLPAKESNSFYPQFAFLTGFNSPTGANKTNVCDDAPVAGPANSCIQTAQFGRYEYETREIDITRAGEVINRGEFMDIRVINSPVSYGNDNVGGFTVPDSVPKGAIDLFNMQQMRFLEVGVAFQNKLIDQLWHGNPTNNTTGGGYLEFPGLDILIGTGKVDAITNTTCPSLDSTIVDFGYNKLDLNGGSNLVQQITYMYRNFKWNAERMNLTPVTWVLAMRQSLFYEITAIWPCAYLSSRCAVNTLPQDVTLASDILTIMAPDQIKMRDDMRAGNYLLIDGERVPVVFDDGITETTSGQNNKIPNPCFASNIYFLPMTIMGGTPVLYWEYFNWAGANAAMEIANEGGAPASSFFWTDGGKYLWVRKPPVNWCMQWQAVIRPRVILRTPQLAGILKNVTYCPLLMAREPFNTDPYFVLGGVSTSRATPSLYAEWPGNHP